jgi:hypothetical protein
VGISIYNHVDDAYAQWGAADLVIDYMRDHNGRWPKNWDALKPYFERNNGRVSGWSYSTFQDNVRIDFAADASKLRQLSIESASVPFDVIHATSIWGTQFGRGPNEMLYQYFRDVPPQDGI